MTSCSNRGWVESCCTFSTGNAGVTGKSRGAVFIHTFIDFIDRSLTIQPGLSFMPDRRHRDSGKLTFMAHTTRRRYEPVSEIGPILFELVDSILDATGP